MKKLIAALFIIGLVMLALHLLKILAGFFLLVISIICLLIAVVLWLVHLIK